MKKTIFTLNFLFVCLSMFAKTNIANGDIPSSTTYDFEANGCYYNFLSLTDLTVELTCHWANGDVIPAYSGDFRVPETVDYSNRTFKVAQINSWAFYDCNLGTLTIPATIQSIAGYYKGFGECQNLIIEDSENPLSIPQDCMIGQVYNSVYLGRNLEGYGNIVDAYKTFHINTNTYSGGEYSTISFGNYVTELGEICHNCQNLTSITLPSSVKELVSTFLGCENLTSVSGDGVELLNYTFIGSGIQTINMPNLKLIIEAFQECKSLVDMNIPEGAILLGGSEYGGVFYNATALTSVYIPATVMSLGEKCFTGCTALQTISVANPTPLTINENNFDALTYLNATLKVPVGSKTAYMYAPVWKNFLNIEEDASLVATSATVLVKTNYIYGGEVTYAFSQEVETYQEDEWSDVYNIVPVGCTMTLTAQPDNNYVLSSLTVNGEDVTEKVVNNEYTIVITGSATYTISANFEYDDNPGSQTYEEVSIVYLDKDMEYLSDQYAVLYLPQAPEIEGFTFIGWRPVSQIIEGAIMIQAVYESDIPSSAPSEYVNPANKAQKLIREGNVYILSGDKTYTIQGQQVR